MNINKNNFLEFLDLISVRGEIENKEMILEGNKNGLNTIVVSPLQEFSVKGILIGDYNELSTIGLNNIKLLKIFLNNFKENIVIMNKHENMMVLASEDKKLQERFILQNPVYIKNTISDEKFMKVYEKGIGNEINFLKEDICELIQFSKSLNKPELDIKSNGEEITVFLESNENNIIYTFPQKQKHEPFDIKISSKLIDILETIVDVFPEDELNERFTTISIKNLSPVVINVINNDYKIIYLLAQMKK